MASRRSMSGSSLGLVGEAVEAGSADLAQFHQALDRQSPVGLHFFLDLPVDGGFPVSACSIRCSSMRCKHPFKKSISSDCWPILRSNSAIRPPFLPIARKRVSRSLTELPPPPLQYIGTHFQRPRRFGHRNPLLQ